MADGYTMLAEVIIKQAADDYLDYGRALAVTTNLPTEQRKRLEAGQAEIIEFMHSEWWKVLTTLDGSYIHRKLDQKLREELSETHPAHPLARLDSYSQLAS